MGCRYLLEIPANTTPFWDYRDELSISDKILFKGERVIVPKSMQPNMLNITHSTHNMDAEKCKRRAKEVLYWEWPGMNSQIENVVSNCQTCSMFQRSQMKEPLLYHEILK